MHIEKMAYFTARIHKVTFLIILGADLRGTSSPQGMYRLKKGSH